MKPSFVHEGINESPPYLYCRDVNNGACPDYEEAPESQWIVMKPKELT